MEEFKELAVFEATMWVLGIWHCHSLASGSYESASTSLLTLSNLPGLGTHPLVCNIGGYKCALLFGIILKLYGHSQAQIAGRGLHISVVLCCGESNDG